MIPNVSSANPKWAENKETMMVRKLVIAIGLTAFAFTAAACNTVKGVGRDIESVGQAGSDAIN